MRVGKVQLLFFILLALLSSSALLSCQKDDDDKVPPLDIELDPEWGNANIVAWLTSPNFGWYGDEFKLDTVIYVFQDTRGALLSRVRIDRGKWFEWNKIDFYGDTLKIPQGVYRKPNPKDTGCYMGYFKIYATCRDNIARKTDRDSIIVFFRRSFGYYYPVIREKDTWIIPVDYRGPTLRFAFAKGQNMHLILPNMDSGWHFLSGKD